MRNPNKPKGYLNLFVSLTKVKRVHKVIWRISSDVKIAEPISFNSGHHQDEISDFYTDILPVTYFQLPTYT